MAACTSRRASPTPLDEPRRLGNNATMTRFAWRARHALFVAVLVATSAGTPSACAQSVPARGPTRVPARLADSTFWRLMNEYSEPWGTFRSENFVSNEISLQWVIPKLVRRVPAGGVYIGVAPD